jgi:hypothetical protein
MHPPGGPVGSRSRDLWSNGLDASGPRRVLSALGWFSALQLTGQHNAHSSNLETETSSLILLATTLWLGNRRIVNWSSNRPPIEGCVLRREQDNRGGQDAQRCDAGVLSCRIIAAVQTADCTKMGGWGLSTNIISLSLLIRPAKQTGCTQGKGAEGSITSRR